MIVFPRRTPVAEACRISTILWPGDRQVQGRARDVPSEPQALSATMTEVNALFPFPLAVTLPCAVLVGGCCGCECEAGEECFDDDWGGPVCIQPCDEHSDCDRGERCNLECAVPDSILGACEAAETGIGRPCEGCCFLLDCFYGTCEFACGGPDDSECPQGWACGADGFCEEAEG